MGEKCGRKEMRKLRYGGFLRDFPLNFQRAFFFFLALQRGVCWVLYSIFCNSLSSTFRRELLIFNDFSLFQATKTPQFLVSLSLVFLLPYKMLLFLRVHHHPF
jgi:hypothetical protein